MNGLERHAKRILGQIAATDREALAADPKRALTERFGLRIRNKPSWLSAGMREAGATGSRSSTTASSCTRHPRSAAARTSP